jgi:hypothetical protein
MTEEEIADIAEIVCNHVPPERFCVRGMNCVCWQAYALPAAKSIARYIAERPTGG